MKFPVEKISQSVVKPSSPTPDHFRHCQLSSIDQTYARVFIPWLLLFPKNSSVTNVESCQRIKKSLSHTLTLFYPFAGRLKGNSHIECNDEGVPFVEAEAKASAIQILHDPYCHDLHVLLPFDVADPSDVIAFVQVTYLECGGMAIGIGISHKIADGFSGAIFLRTWAAIARGDSNIDSPLFDAAEYFPPVNLLNFDPSFMLVKDDNWRNIVERKFLFNVSSIAALRERYTDKIGQKPTRVETLTAFVCSRIKAATQISANADIVCSVKQVFNLRTRINRPLSNMCIGNYVYESHVAALETSDDDACLSIIDQMGKLKRKLDPEFVMKNFQDSEAHVKMMEERARAEGSGHIVPLYFASTVGFGIYETDFGWGKPLWVGFTFWPFVNVVIMVDAKEKGGIELLIYLKKEDMARLEEDQEFCEFVSPSRI